MSAPFHDQVVIVTGASGGIGEQLALQLAAQGARLALAARRAEELNRVARGCVEAGGAAIIVPTDVTDAASCRELVERTFVHYGRLDMLVNNAGLGMWARVADVTDLSVFERVMRVNYLGAVYCTVAALPHLRATHGRIVCISSLAGRTGVPLRSGYAASKHAMAGFFDSLRIELRETGVSVTLVDPGFVGTGAQGRNLGTTGQPLGHVPIDLAAAMAPAECARQAIRAAAARQRERVMTLRGRIGLWLKLVAPGLVDRLAAAATARGK